MIIHQWPFFFIFFLFLLSQNSSFSNNLTPLEFYQNQAIEKNLHLDLTWLRLGHYTKDFLGGYSSEADGPLFYLHENGKTDPKSELLKTLEGVFSTKIYSDENHAQSHPQCRFPARFQWLKNQLNIKNSDLPKPHCASFEQFFNRLGAESAYLVFSSYYMNSAGSAFGHTLLRVGNKHTKTMAAGKSQELLDTGINYAANVTTENPLLYAFFGMAGVFNGTFSSVPYFYKVREYSDFEARDLWSYELNLTQKELDFFIAHLWELGSTYFDYFFFTENCSYHILKAIEVVRPELKLSENLPYWVIPADTLRVLNKNPGFVRKIHYRPSASSSFKVKLAELSEQEVKIIKKMITQKNNDALSEIKDDTSKIKILDTLMDYIDYRHPETITGKDIKNLDWKQSILIARSKIHQPSPQRVFEIPKEDQPDLGHPSSRAGIHFGDRNNNGNYIQLAQRFAYHDPLDPSQGYPKGAQIEFFHGQARYYFTEKKLKIDDLTFFRVRTMTPLNFFDRFISWNAELGAVKENSKNCDECLALNLQFGGGYSAQILPKTTGYFNLGPKINWSYQFEGSKVHLGIGPEIGLLTDWTKSLKSKTSLLYRYKFLAKHSQESILSFNIRYSIPTTDFAIDAYAHRFFWTHSKWEVGAGFYFYY